VSARRFAEGDVVDVRIARARVEEVGAVQVDDGIVVEVDGQVLAVDVRGASVEMAVAPAVGDDSPLEGDFYADLATELRRLADGVESLAGRDLPTSYVSFDLLPKDHKLGDDEKVAVIDAIGQALLGEPGQTRELPSSGAFHHKAEGRRGGLLVRALTSVDSPEKRELRRELEEMRAERDALLAAGSAPADVEPAADGGDPE
jgi:hypothetical protein